MLQRTTDELKSPQSSAPGLVVSGATVKWRNSSVFESLDFTAEGGKITCLLGASGVGKSTLLRLILGLLSADEWLGGLVTNEQGQPVSGQAAYMAQTDLLLPWLSALDNVLIGERLRSGPVSVDAKDRARALLARVGLDADMDKLPGQLSGGMRQRCALARTLMEDRPIVMMDEPFSNLDAITRKNLQDLAAELLTDKTVILVTHDPLEALRLADTIVILGGHPAHVIERLELEGPVPRRVDTDIVAQYHGQLIDRLSGAAP